MKGKERREIEREFVHEAYETIAGHFSETRYKAWPVVQDFIASQPSQSWGLDVGCGNGKNMLNSAEGELNWFGVDISLNLLKLASSQTAKRNKGLVQADMCSLPFRTGFRLLHCSSTSLGQLGETRLGLTRTIKDL